jgi:hypothetical protein
MEELAKQLGYNTAPLIYAGMAYGFFHWLDENASDEAKGALARTMTFKDYKSEQVASTLVEVFDRIYSYPLLRWRAFFRSLLFTTVVSAIFIFEVGVDFDVRGRPTMANMPILMMDLRGWWFVALFLNVLTDYLSLLVFRPLLIRSGTKPVIGLTIAAVSAAAIVYAANSLRWRLLSYYECVYFMQMFRACFFDRGFTFIFGLSSNFHYAWPAIIVFVWLPLFALGIVIARLLTPLSWVVGRTQWFLKEGKEHPLKAIGYVAAVAVFIGTVAARAVV